MPAGAYDVITDEEMIEGLSFTAFRRCCDHDRGACGGLARFGDGDDIVGSVDLSDAQRIDASTPDD